MCPFAKRSLPRNREEGSIPSPAAKYLEGAAALVWQLVLNTRVSVNAGRGSTPPPSAKQLRRRPLGTWGRL